MLIPMLTTLLSSFPVRSRVRIPFAAASALLCERKRALSLLRRRPSVVNSGKEKLFSPFEGPTYQQKCIRKTKSYDSKESQGRL